MNLAIGHVVKDVPHISPERARKICKRQCRYVRKACGLKIKPVNGKEGDILIKWGTPSRTWPTPGQGSPVIGYLDRSAIAAQPTAALAEALFAFLISHEALGHGLGLDHCTQNCAPGIMAVDGGAGHGYDPNNNPKAKYGKEEIKALVKLYGPSTIKK